MNQLDTDTYGTETYPPGLAYFMAGLDWAVPRFAALPPLAVFSILIFAALMHLLAAPQLIDMVSALPAR